jgi:hypothetical protein
MNPAGTRRCTMAELNAKDRERLRSTQFAYVDSKGGEHLPIHDGSHVRNAIARFNQTEFESKAAKERARAEDPECRGEARHRGRRRLEHPPAGPSASGSFDEVRAPRLTSAPEKVLRVISTIEECPGRRRL